MSPPAQPLPVLKRWSLRFSAPPPEFYYKNLFEAVCPLSPMPYFYLFKKSFLTFSWCFSKAFLPAFFFFPLFSPTFFVLALKYGVF